MIETILVAVVGVVPARAAPAPAPARAAPPPAHVAPAPMFKSEPSTPITPVITPIPQYIPSNSHCEHKKDEKDCKK
jgi:hypothetical protein